MQIKAALNVFKSMGIDANEDDVLALMLLREKYVLGDRSKWAVHIASLPDTVHSPFFFTEEEMEAFKPCNFYNLATRIRTQTAASYEQIVKVLAAMGKEAPITPAHFTLPAFQWATGMVWSRFMSLKTMGSQVLKHMVPFVDMFNHSPTSMVHHSFDFVTKTISVVSDQPWDAGKQVFLNYGEASNMRLLQLHGFVLPKADLESYGLEINLPLELPSFEKRINMIKEYASFASMPSPLLLAEIEARAGVRAGEEASSEAAVKLDRWKAFVGTMVRYSTGAGITVELFKGVPHLGLLRIMRILHCPDELLVELGHTMRRSPDEGLGIEEEANMLQS
ncbi:SET domain-containing protein-lysine N-methyltransferase, partial [archaeon]